MLQKQRFVSTTSKKTEDFMIMFMIDFQYSEEECTLMYNNILCFNKFYSTAKIAIVLWYGAVMVIDNVVVCC